MTKKPRRLGRGFSSFLEDNHRPLGGGQCSQQLYLTTSQRAEQINFRLWAGGHFTLRKPLCAYGLISQPVQLSALPGRAPTNRPSPPGRGSFYFRPPQLAASFVMDRTAFIDPPCNGFLAWVVWALAVVLHWPILDDFTSFSSATRPSV